MADHRERDLLQHLGRYPGKEPIVVSAAMRILVTGLSGFIGSSLGPFLEARGHEVRGAGREVAAQAEAFRGCDAVVHLANIAHARVEADLLRRVNVEGTVRAAALAAEQGVRRFVYLSSVKANEPQDAYGHAKLAAEHALRQRGGRVDDADGHPASAAGVWAPREGKFPRPDARRRPRLAAAASRASRTGAASSSSRIFATRSWLACNRQRRPGRPTSSATGRRSRPRALPRASAMRSAGRLACSGFRPGSCPWTSSRARSWWTMRRCATSLAGSRRSPSRKD